MSVNTTAAAIEIDTGRLQCRIPREGQFLIESMTIEGRVVAEKARLLCRLDNSDSFTSRIAKVTMEQTGPVRAVVKIEGVHKANQGAREWLPFIVRLYFYAGSEQVRLVHTIVFDGDDQKDFIRGLGVAFTVPMREQVHNRHVRFSGEGDGLWAEPVQPATGRRLLAAPGTQGRGPGQSILYADQLAGKRLPNKEAFNASGQAANRLGRLGRLQAGATHA